MSSDTFEWRKDMTEPRRWPDDIANEEVLAEYERRMNRARNIRNEVAARIKKNRPLWRKILVWGSCVNILGSLGYLVMAPSESYYFYVNLIAGYCWVAIVEPALQKRQIERDLKEYYPDERALLASYIE